jgi:hypothetical protein
LQTPDLAALKAHLLKEGRIEEDLFIEVIKRVGAMLKEEPNVLRLKYPVTGNILLLTRLLGVRARVLTSIPSRN